MTVVQRNLSSGKIKPDIRWLPAVAVFKAVHLAENVESGTLHAPESQVSLAFDQPWLNGRSIRKPRIRSLHVEQGSRRQKEKQEPEHVERTLLTNELDADQMWCKCGPGVTRIANCGPGTSLNLHSE